MDEFTSKVQKSLPSRLKMLSPNNQQWYNIYLDSLSINNRTQNTIVVYKNIIINLLEIGGERDINTVKLEDIKSFIYKTKSSNRINTKIAAIAGFFKLISDTNQFPYDISEIEQLRMSKEKVINDTRRAMPLSVKDIVKIRNILKDDLNRLFVFEAVYQLGLSLAELLETVEDNYNSKTNTFSFSSGKSLKVSEKISNIIQQKRKVLTYKGKGRYQKILSEIGDMIGRVLTWSDIIETREMNFFMCSICKRKFENIPENWALLHYGSDVDSVKWIVCRECALKGGNNE